MNVKFYLRDLTKEKGNLNSGQEQPIWCYITFNGRRLRLSTQIKVFPKNWNEKRQEIRGSASSIEKLNLRLKSIRSKAERISTDYALKSEVLTEQLLKDVLLPILFPDRYKQVKRVNNICDFLNEFTADNPRDLKAGTMKSYEQLKPLLIEFSKKQGKSCLNFDSINSEWGDLFSKFLKVEKNHSINNVDKHKKNIKSLMNYSLEKGLHNNIKFEYIKREKEETKEIFLNEGEIIAIYDLDVLEEYQQTKDVFVFSCLTGLRISDVLALKKHNWKGDYIEIETKKTEEKLTIPLRKTAKIILQKYNGELPYIYEQKYNKQLKDIAEQIPALQVEEIVYSTKGGNRIQKSVYKYELVKSHTARRSFATNEYLRGTDPLFIRAVTGHKTEKDFFNYIQVKQTQKASSMLELFMNREF